MKFLYPQVLWALLVLAIPIIIHLFNFKRYKTIYFSSLKFVKRIEEQTKSTQKLKHLLVLLSRLLALFFLILAFAQPYVSSDADEKLNDAPVYCVYIDNSFSMQALGPEGELLSEAREKAKEIVEKAPLNARFLVTTNEMSGREEHFLTKADALDRIDNIEVRGLNRSITDILDWQDEIIAQEAKSTGIKSKVNMVLLSDFQRNQLLKTVKRTNTTRYFPVQLIPESRENLILDSVWLESPLIKMNEANKLNIRVKNLSPEPRQNVEIDLRIGKWVKTIFVDINANASHTTSVSYLGKESGMISGVATLMDKQVHFDDSYHFTFDIRKSAGVLILDGEDPVEQINTVYALDSYYKVVQTKITSLAKTDFVNRDLVVLNGVNSIAEGTQLLLKDFVTSGGTVALFPGKDPDLAQWSALASKFELGGITGISLQGNKISNLNYKDPFFIAVFDKEVANLNMPAVSKAFKSGSSPGAQALITMQNGYPLLSYRRAKGNAFIFYSSLHEDYSKFTSNALFSTVLLRIGENAHRKQPLSLTIGESGLYPIYKPIDEMLPIKLVNGDFELIPALQNQFGVNYLLLNKTDNLIELPAGNYSIQQGNTTFGKLSLNYARSESDLNCLTKEEVVNLFGAVSQSNLVYGEISNNSDFSMDAIAKPFSFWKILIILSLIFVLTEMLIIRFVKS